MRWFSPRYPVSISSMCLHFWVCRIGRSEKRSEIIQHVIAIVTYKCIQMLVHIVFFYVSATTQNLCIAQQVEAAYTW